MTRTVSRPIDAPVEAAAAAVHAHGLGKTIDERRILHDLSFTVPTGRLTALLGANGAGKSTLLKVLATLTPPSEGRLDLFGRPVRRDGAALRSRLGMIGHGAMVYRDLSALENLVFFGKLYGLREARARAQTLLADVGLAHRAHDPAGALSRGMLQRLSIARAMMHDPDLLLADEPFAGLDAPSRARLEAMLRELHAQGKTIILANHDVAQSLDLAEHVLVLRGGRLVVDGPAGGLDAGLLLSEITGP